MAGVDEYLSTFEAVRLRGRWSPDSPVLRFAALVLAGVPLPDPKAALDATAAILRERAGFWSALNSPLRFVVAAMILRRGLDAKRVHDRIENVRHEMRRRRMPRGGMLEVFAALEMVLHYGGAAVPAVVLDRMQEILERWTEDHSFLTGVDDYPMASLHSLRNEPVATLTRRIEEIYGWLKGAGYSRGNQLQLAAHLLGIAPWKGSEAAERFGALAAAFVRNGWKIRPNRYDEVALLSLTAQNAESAARDVLATRDRIVATSERRILGVTLNFSPDLAFSLASGLVMSSSPSVRDAHAAISAQAILAAQAAAVAATCALIAVV